MTDSITADYLIMGAGAAGMAFADSVLTETEATLVIVDRRDRPGGHWNDAYPFVRLHQPASFYGVNSAPLGSGTIDQIGLNAGFHALAAGTEVVSHYDQTMRQRFLPSGRVQYLPMSEVGDDRVVTSLLSGERCAVQARRFVDATHSRMRIPSTTPPAYAIAPGADCIPPNDLPRAAPAYDDFVVIGAGKTGMDACIWLLENGADPDRIRWIVPRDSWILDRANFQPGDDFFAAFCKSIADQAEAVALADSVEDVFSRLEAAGELRRLDPNVAPEAYHCAILSDREVAGLRRIEGVIRLGRVTAIDADEIRLEQGAISTGPSTLAHRLLSRRHPHAPLHGRLRGRPDNHPMGAHLPTGLQRRTDRLRGVDVHGRGGEEPHLHSDCAAHGSARLASHVPGRSWPTGSAGPKSGDQRLDGGVDGSTCLLARPDLGSELTSRLPNISAATSPTWTAPRTRSNNSSATSQPTNRGSM